MSPSLRIAQIAPLFESVPPKLYGGTERIVDSLSKSLRNKGHHVTVFCTGDSTTEVERVSVHPEALRIGTVPPPDPFAYQMKMLGAVAKRAHEFDIIHNHYDYPLLALTRMVSTPVVSTMHGRMDLPDHPAAFESFAEAPLVSISRAQQKPLPHLNWTATVLHGIDTKDLRFESQAGKYLAFLGRFSPEKRPDWAIEIAKRSGVPLKIAAKISELDVRYYQEYIRPLIDGKFIEYVGEISESQKSEFLGNALALVFPIDWPEPFGLVMAEAMACGTPVLARPCGSVPEVLIDGKTGFIRKNIEELAALVPQTRDLNRFFIRRYVEETFSIERMTEEYLDVYTKLIHSTRYKPALAG